MARDRERDHRALPRLRGDVLACIYDGWCHVGCPIGALANPLVTYLADARKAGAEVRPWSTVTRALTTAKGNRVTGVEYYDQKKEKQFQPAAVVVLAAWAAQNPRIMLNSANDKHPKGLANSSGLVGKYMMTHYASGTWAIFDENVENHMGTTGAQYMSYDRYAKTSHKGGFGSSFIVTGSALKPSGLGGFANARLDLFGPDLHAFMKRAAHGLTRINSNAHDMDDWAAGSGRLRHGDGGHRTGIPGTTGTPLNGWISGFTKLGGGSGHSDGLDAASRFRGSGPSTSAVTV